MLETVEHAGITQAIIVRNSYSNNGVNFFTPGEYSQQLAYMHHPAGKMIEPHLHNLVQREVLLTQEVLIIKRGKLRVDFYDDETNYIESRILNSGDIILLAAGGHGFEAIEELEMIEVKQGPYAGDRDKTRFVGVQSSIVRINGDVS